MSSPVNFAEQLASGLRELTLTVPETVQTTLLAFLNVLEKWNKAYNLTAITDRSNMIAQHLLDSVSIAPYCTGSRVLDVGSGAGFPGIPLALVFPEKSFVLVDSNQKKIAFLIHVTSYFGLRNVEVIRTRVEAYEGAQFDTIICRAFGTMEDIVQKTHRLMSPQGRWVIMKGTYPHEELNRVSLPYTVHRLRVPGLTAERHVVLIRHE